MASEKDLGLLTIYVFNVGSGDHILLEFPNGQFGIIDFFWQNNMGMIEPPAFSFLEKLRKIDPDRKISLAFIHISHPDRDHMLGLQEFWQWAKSKNIPLDYFWWFGGASSATLLNSINNIILEFKEQNIQFNTEDEEEQKQINTQQELFHWLKTVRHIHEKSKPGIINHEEIENIRTVTNKLAGNVKAFCYGPLQHEIKSFHDKVVSKKLVHTLLKGSKKGPNNNLVSSIVKIVYDSFHLLFGGDAHLNSWKESITKFDREGLSENMPDVSSHWIKASHHGSKNSSSVELWERLLKTDDPEDDVKERMIAISAGMQHEHPDIETIKDVEAAAMDKNLVVDIKSTNIFLKPDGVKDNCLSLQDAGLYPVPSNCINLDWIYKDEESTALEKSIREKKNLAKENFVTKENLSFNDNDMLLAYVYTFDPNTKKISYKLGITSLLKDERDGDLRCFHPPASMR